MQSEEAIQRDENREQDPASANTMTEETIANNTNVELVEMITKARQASGSVQTAETTPNPLSNSEDHADTMNNDKLPTTAKSFAAITNTSENNGEIQVITFILPFTKDSIKSPESRENAYKESSNAILRQIPTSSVKHTTITRTFVELKGKHLHALKIIAPSQCQSAFRSFRSNGVTLMQKTVFPFGERRPERIRTGFPRTVNVKLTGLPGICQDHETLKALELPCGIRPVASIQKVTETSDVGTFYTGSAVLQISLGTQTDLDNAKAWSFQSRQDGHTWRGISFVAHIPSLHSCDHCQKEGKQFHGHDRSWCRAHFAAMQRQRIEDEKQRALKAATETDEDSDMSDSESGDAPPSPEVEKDFFQRSRSGARTQ